MTELPVLRIQFIVDVVHCANTLIYFTELLNQLQRGKKIKVKRMKLPEQLLHARYYKDSQGET